MPGPVPSVSTKTRGYVQPPTFHTERTNLFNTLSPMNASFSPDHFLYPPTNQTNRNRTMSTTTYQNTVSQQSSYNTPAYQPAWKNSMSNTADTYVPSYQKKVQMNPTLQRQTSNDQGNYYRQQQHHQQQQQQQQQYSAPMRQQQPPPQQQHHHQQQQQQQQYRPASTQPSNLIHRQFNSPMSLYSNDNVQEVMKNHVSHISRVR